MSTAKNIGLVLSGGGARGLAHAGVLMALDELDLRVSIIAGTSAGAIIAVLYAGGVAPEDMPSIIKKNKLFDLKRIRFDLKGVIKSDLFREILHEFVPVKTFEELSMPVLVHATDFTHAKPVVFEKGHFTDAVVASCSIPLIFTPVMMHGKAMVDGGLTDNFPVEILQGRCDQIIGVNVNPLGVHKKKNLSGTIERIFQMAISGGLDRKSKLCDVYLEPQRLAQYSVFDTKDADAIFRIGYEEAMRDGEELKMRMR